MDINNGCICHFAGGWVLSDLYLLASVETKEAAVIGIRYYTNFSSIQATQIDENGGWVNLEVHDHD